jgi:hypothetical protein
MSQKKLVFCLYSLHIINCCLLQTVLFVIHTSPFKLSTRGSLDYHWLIALNTVDGPKLGNKLQCPLFIFPSNLHNHLVRRSKWHYCTIIVSTEKVREGVTMNFFLQQERSDREMYLEAECAFEGRESSCHIVVKTFSEL